MTDLIEQIGVELFVGVVTTILIVSLGYIYRAKIKESLRKIFFVFELNKCGIKK